MICGGCDRGVERLVLFNFKSFELSSYRWRVVVVLVV